MIEYARFLAEKADEEAWDKRLSDPKYSPKLRVLMAEVEADIVAGKTQPLDPSHL